MLILDRCKPASNLQSAQNESNNPLANLLCQYNSDSDTEDSKKDTQKLDDQVNDFLKVSLAGLYSPLYSIEDIEKKTLH